MQLRIRFKKISQQRRIIYLCLLQIFKSTIRLVRPWDVFLLFLKINIFIFMRHVKYNPLCCIASIVCLKWIFISLFVILKDFWEAKFIRGSIIFPHAFFWARIWCWIPTLSMMRSFSIHWGQETYLTAINFRLYKIYQFCTFLDFSRKLIHAKYFDPPACKN